MGRIRDEVRRQNPHLLGWLFRRNEGKSLWNLGARALRARRYVEGLQLVILTFSRDPGFFIQPAVRAALLAVARRGLARATAAHNCHAQYHFLDPRAEASIVSPTPSCSHAIRKRVASLKLRAQPATIGDAPRQSKSAMTFKSLSATLNVVLK